MIKILLYPLSLLYGIAVYFRNRFYDLNILKSKDFDISVISVGNITVGGTGKTPHVEYLAGLLKDKFEVAVLSRGYKRKSSGFRYVETTSAVAETGDEPLQIKRKFPDLKVAVCENRVSGVEQILETSGKKTPDVILLDDAFQHRRITAGINILLIDYNRPLKEDTLLPAGRLRESASQIRRANLIILTKCPPEITPIMRRIHKIEVQLKPYQDLFFTTMQYGRLQPLFKGNKLEASFYDQQDYALLVVTGVAFPEPIPGYLKQFSKEMEWLRFSDHHDFTEKDIDLISTKFLSLKAKKKLIVTTEKDAVRLKEMTFPDEELKKVIFFLPVEVKFLDEEAKIFNKRIVNYVGENKSNRSLH